MTNAGLCGSCRWTRRVTNRRGSTFYRCARADTDARFSRYPDLPVLVCPGYDPAPEVERHAPERGRSRLAEPLEE